MWTDKLIGKSLEYRHQCPSSTNPPNVMKFEEQNRYYSLDVTTKFCYGKTRSTSRAKAFSIMFYAVSLEHEISRKERCWYVLKNILLFDYFDTFSTRIWLKYYSSIHPHFSTKKSISIKVLVSLLWKKQNIIIHTKSYWFLLYTKSRLSCLKHFKFLEMKSRMKKVLMWLFPRFISFHLTKSCGFVAEKLLLVKPN